MQSFSDIHVISAIPMLSILFSFYMVSEILKKKSWDLGPWTFIWKSLDVLGSYDSEEIKRNPNITIFSRFTDGG